MRGSVTLAGMLLAPQIALSQSLALGAKAGPNTAYHVGWCCGETNPFDARSGFTGGLTAAVHLAGPISLQTEILYSEKGVRGSDSFEMRLRYLEVPVLLRLGPAPRQWALRPVLLVGAGPARELSCSGRARPLSIPERPAPVGPLNCADFRTTEADFSLIGAAGADFKLGPITWTTEVRYTHGVKDLTDRWNFVRTTNRSIALLLGLRFGRG